MSRATVAPWLAGLALALAFAGCGKYGPPVRNRPSETVPRDAPANPPPSEEETTAPTGPGSSSSGR